MRVIRSLLSSLALACLSLLPAAALAAAMPGRTELRIEVRHADGAQALLTRELDEREQAAYGVSQATDQAPATLGAPLIPQPPADGDYPPGAYQLEYVQKRGVWVRNTRFEREKDGAWKLADDSLGNPRDKAALGKPLVGSNRPVQ
jgi:hypothetical protein